MLATLLRWILLGQMGAGAWLGYVLAGHWLGNWEAGFLGAVSGPLVLTAVGTLASCVVSRDSGEPAQQWWKSFVGEFYAGLRIFVFRQPWTSGTPPLLPAIGEEERIPVVLVHGYLCNHRIWDDVERALRVQGHTVQAVNLEPLFGSIDDYASTIEAAVQTLLRQTGHTRVALVGHSMGGLAIRAWIRAHGTQRVAKLLTLGTPHAGTRLAKGSTTTNGRQMMWQSDWLAALAAAETQSTRNLFQIAITPQDNIVCPQRAQTLKGIQPVIFEGIGHLQMCTHPPLIAWLTQQLQVTDVSRQESATQHSHA